MNSKFAISRKSRHEAMLKVIVEHAVARFVCELRPLGCKLGNWGLIMSPIATQELRAPGAWWLGLGLLVWLDSWFDSFYLYSFLDLIFFKFLIIINFLYIYYLSHYAHANSLLPYESPLEVESNYPCLLTTTGRWATGSCQGVPCCARCCPRLCMIGQ